MSVVGILVVIGVSMRSHSGPSWSGVSSQLRLLNFNVQQGFSRTGVVNFDSIYDMLDAERPHVTTLVSYSSSSLVSSKSIEPFGSSVVSASPVAIRVRWCALT